MSPEDLEAEVAGALAYESLHVPALFGQWAPIVLEAVDFHPGERLLDVACGTGVLARTAAAAGADPAAIHGLDAGEGMLAVATELAPSIDWRQGAAEALPYKDASFDVVVSQFGLMFFADRRAAVNEMLRVLNAGGRLGVVVWDSLENSQAYSIEVELLERRAGVAAANALRAPFEMGDRKALVDLFVSAGASSVDVSTLRGKARFPSVRTMVEADLRGWLPVMGVMLPDDLIDTILEEAEQVLGEFVTDAGTVEFDSPAHVLTAAAPHH